MNLSRFSPTNHPLYKKYEEEANKYARIYGIDSSEASQHGGEWDAFRHAYASAAATKDIGEYWARNLGNANEVWGTLTRGKPWDTNMDLWNNSVGRDIGRTAANRDEIARRVYESLRRGHLISEPKRGTRRFDPVFPPGEGGIERLYHHEFPSPSPFIDLLRELYLEAERWLRRDPIILDLDGDGVETLAQESGRHFDHVGNGFAEQTGWVGADDGLLIRDRQPGAAITSGSQLFGDFTLLSNGKTAAHGFEALADLDDNHDGVIDQADAAWAELAIWKDSNSDAYLDSGERLSLEQAGVRQLRLSYRHGDQVDGQGNQHLQLGTYLTSQGEERAADPARSKSSKMLTSIQCKELQRHGGLSAR